jgi:SAM-dependent methyltransferase
MTTDELKAQVKAAYAEIALNADAVGKGSSCCGTPHGLAESESDGASCDSLTLQICQTMPEEYDTVLGYQAEANLGLGCGLPTNYAHIKAGNTVVDLGSGAGNDAFVARIETGAKGKVIGIDFTAEMVQRARTTAEKLKYTNVQFIEGDIENIPLKDKTAHVVVSNCVLNLVPNKARAFSEIHRILKPGGHFSISDIVTIGHIPLALRNNADAYTGCISGSINKKTYLSLIEAAGFINITEQKLKLIELPDELLQETLSEEELKLWNTGKHGIFSLQVYGERKKPSWWF